MMVFSNAMNGVVVQSPEEFEWTLRQYPFNIRPVTDDMPFFWHFIPFQTAALGPLQNLQKIGAEGGLAERLLMVLLGLIPARAHGMAVAIRYELTGTSSVWYWGGATNVSRPVLSVLDPGPGGVGSSVTFLFDATPSGRPSPRARRRSCRSCRASK